MDLFHLGEILSCILSFSLAIGAETREGQNETCHELLINSCQRKEYRFYYDAETNIYQATTGYFFGIHLEEPWVSTILKTTLSLLPPQLNSEA